MTTTAVFIAGLTYSLTTVTTGNHETLAVATGVLVPTYTIKTAGDGQIFATGSNLPSASVSFISPSPTSGSSSQSAASTTSAPRLPSGDTASGVTASGETGPGIVTATRTPSSDTSASSPGNTTTPLPHKTFTSGEVAGAAVGTGIALSIITFFLTFCIIRAQKRKRNGREKGVDTGWTPDPAPASVARANSNRPVNVDNFLPQSADDKTIQTNASTLFDQMELHVENFYHNSRVSVSESEAAAVSHFSSNYLPGSLISLLSHPRSRISAIKHCFIQKMLSCISPDGGAGPSFLPQQFATLPPASNGTGDSRREKPGYDTAVSRLRALTAYVLSNPGDDSTYISGRDNAINQVAQELSHAFAPWANLKVPEQERISGLIAVLKSAADFGVFILSQPSGFAFRWEDRRSAGSQAIVIKPAVVKVVDERGQRLRTAQVVVDMVAQQI